MKVKLHPTQYEIATDPHRFRIICAGRRWGKSTLSRLIALKWATDKPNSLIWIVSPTFQQGKDIHWLQGFKREIPREYISKWNDSELSVTLKNGSMIALKSAENPDRLKGVKLNGLIVDEIAAMRSWDFIWQEALRPTLTDYEAPAVFISTPRGFNHFYDLFQSGQNQDPIYKSWKFTTYDNPHIPTVEIEQAKKELTDDTFHQEYMADFRKYTGLVYKEFDRDIHVIEQFDIPDSWSIYRCIDFGSTNPTACLWIAVDGDDNWYVNQEHYQTGETIDYHAGVINSLSTRSVAQTYGDPSGAQWISEFAQRGIYITPANKETGQSQEGWVRFGIEKVSEKLKVVQGRTVAFPRVETTQTSIQGMPAMYIFKSCTNTLREIESYRWKEKSVTQAQDMNTPEQPEKANDHAMDALRYFAVSYKRLEKDLDYINEGLRSKWAI